MSQYRPDRRIVNVTRNEDGDKKSDSHFEAFNIFYSLKQNFPEVYRHLLGIARAYLKDR